MKIWVQYIVYARYPIPVLLRLHIAIVPLRIINSLGDDWAWYQCMALFCIQKQRFSADLFLAGTTYQVERFLLVGVSGT